MVLVVDVVVLFTDHDFCACFGLKLTQVNNLC
jgi:hypothetical protein